MPEVATRADSLRMYLTGAGSAGGTQNDPDASLGNHRASKEATSLGIAIASAIANITVDFAGASNALGAGSLECIDANTLKWKDFGGTFGANVSIANGETKLLEADGRPEAFIRITRTSATALVAGTSTITLTEEVNNLFGMDNVSSAEALAGDSEYRGGMLRNDSAGSVNSVKLWIGTIGTSRVSGTGQLGASGSGTITIASGNFNDWPQSGWCRIEQSGGTLREIVYYTSRTATTLTVPSAGRARLGTSAGAGAGTDNIHSVPGMRIAKAVGGVTAGSTAIATIANESTAPAAVTWNTGITAATGLSVGTMTTGQQIGIWFHREIPVATQSIVVDSHRYNLSFDAG